MTDDWIAKSIPYTINGPSLVMALVSNGTMRYGISRPNLIEFNFVVSPDKISPDQIRTLATSKNSVEESYRQPGRVA